MITRKRKEPDLELEMVIRDSLELQITSDARHKSVFPLSFSGASVGREEYESKPKVAEYTEGISDTEYEFELLPDVDDYYRVQENAEKRSKRLDQESIRHHQYFEQQKVKIEKRNWFKSHDARFSNRDETVADPHSVINRHDMQGMFVLERKYPKIKCIFQPYFVNPPKRDFDFCTEMIKMNNEIS
jgi:hypothetical protein